MTERDKLIAQAEALEWASGYMLEWTAGHAACLSKAAKYRALAAQQPEPVEPVIDGYPLEQGIPPADHTAAADTLRNMTEADFDKAHGVTPDLDALVVELIEYANREGIYWIADTTNAIIDLRAQLAEYKEEILRIHNEKVDHFEARLMAAKSITRLEAENKEARELLDECYDNAGMFSIDLAAKLTAFRAKQGDTQ